MIIRREQFSISIQKCGKENKVKKLMCPIDADGLSSVKDLPFTWSVEVWRWGASADVVLVNGSWFKITRSDMNGPRAASQRNVNKHSLLF
ncbi:hypothetical protein TNCV_3460071 [Trichonephila clavipes]|nr:hypothetical protein TNCV_3460071 [Trichonephila clavipes]